MARRIALLLPIIPIVASMIAAVLFAMQHGFGGGHGHLDVIIGLLAMPGILLLEHLPFLETTPDLLLVVGYPGLFNLTVWVAVALVLRAVLRRKPTV